MRHYVELCWVKSTEENSAPMLESEGVQIYDSKPPLATSAKCDFTNYGDGQYAGPLVKLSKAYLHHICTL